VSDVGFEPDIIIECTGVGQIISESIRKIGAGGIVCLTGVGTGGTASGAAIADVAAKNVIGYELLPYHRFGESKYGFLGMVYELEDFRSPTPDSLQRLQAIIDEAFDRPQKEALT
jgi:threonine dehydrogenase-like Zn-dependent dehydrogenase